MSNKTPQGIEKKIMDRNGVCNKKKRTKYRAKQRYYDFEKIYPLQNFEIDLKEILDMRALPPSTYHRAFGINHKLTFKTDNGEEFGGKSVNKLEYLNKYVFSPLNCTLLHNPKGKWEYFSLWKEAIEQMMKSFIFPRLKNVKT